MIFAINEYKERAPRVQAVEFTGAFEVAGLIANFCEASSFVASKSTGSLLLTFDGAEEGTGYQVSVKVGDMVVKSESIVRAVPADEFNGQFEIAC